MKKQIPWHTAFIIFFIAAYVTATLTTMIVNDVITEVLSQLGIVALIVTGFMTIVFIISLLLKRTDIVDAAWGMAFIVAAVGSFLINRHDISIGWNTQTIVSTLVILWGARLGYFILRRLLSHPEDKRYVELRKQWKGAVAVNTYFRIFITQALLATVISIAVIHINLSEGQQPNILTLFGVIIWATGFVFESVGDAQLKRHLRNPDNKGKLMIKGLWQYTRHPNYFGESTQWWGIFVIALGTPFGLVGVITPVLITYLLLFVSGVPMTEKAFEGRKGWKEYKSRTSKFFPLIPKP